MGPNISYMQIKLFAYFGSLASKDLKTSTEIINFQPIAEISAAVAELNEFRKSSGLFPVLVHTDAAQTIGKVPVDVRKLCVDYLTIVGHKVSF
jgi:cysteine sulfinate desulfinase/cysteine desulfurase-like protein